MEPDLGHWFAGFVDGEACFVVRHQKHTRHGFLCEFTIGLRADDGDVLEMLHRELGIGVLRHRRPGAGSSPGSSPQVVWRVSDRTGCGVLRDVLRSYPLRSKKARDFRIWAQAVDLWLSRSQANGQWAYDTAYALEMAALASALTDGRRYDAPDLPVEMPLCLFPDEIGVHLVRYDEFVRDRRQAKAAAEA